MELIVNLFNSLFLGPILNLLIFIYKILESIGLPGALGFSIMLLTIGIRLLIWPFTSAQVKSAYKMASLRPHLDELKQKHKDDKKALQLAQMQLYKEHGVNPASGCLPALIQIPIFIALYQAITNVFPQTGGSLDHINSLLYNNWLKLNSPPDPYFFGFNLATKPAEFTTVGYWLLLIPLLTAALTFIQSKMTLPRSPIKVYPSDSPKEKKDKEGMDEMMSGVQSQMVYLMPIMVGYFAFQFPSGLAIYWNTFTILGIIQQYLVTGWGGMLDIFTRLGLKVEDKVKKEPTTKVSIERKVKSKK